MLKFNSPPRQLNDTPPKISGVYRLLHYSLYYPNRFLGNIYCSIIHICKSIIYKIA